MSELADLLGISRVTLNLQIKRELGVSAQRLLKELQVERAQQILQETPLTTTQVGYRSGFGTRRTFYRSFRRITGVTPATFRRARCRGAKPRKVIKITLV